MSFPHGVFSAAHAARQRSLQRQRDEKEEVEMTSYTKDDLDSNWEFKIVRSESGAFRRPQTFQQLLEEEEISGWEMIEKLDDRRVRFKRCKDLRSRDGMLPPGIDPYRSHFGGANRSLVMVLIGLATAAALGAGLLFFGPGGSSETGQVFPTIAITNVSIIGLIFVIMLVAIIARRR
ncbi:MAG: hypothetical protein ABFS17_09320 [Chloroflexota bacterium]